jgi:hypothetical protein
MKRLLLLFSFSLAAFAQTNDVFCNAIPVTLTAPGTVQFDNRAPGCDSWTISYVADSGATFNLTFEAANGQATPGSWSTYPGNTSNSSPSFGTATPGIATFCGLATCVPTDGVTVATPWVRVNVDTLSGGTLRVFFYGYRTGYASGLGGGGGGGGGTGCPNPCPVEGVDASGVAPTVPPIAVAGFDGTDGRPIRTDSTGREIVVGGAASGGVQSGNPVPIAGNDGTNVRNVSTDTSGRVNVNVNGTVPVSGVCPNPCPVTQSTSPWVDNISQWASAVLGAATAWGVAPTGNVPGVNANIISNVQPAGQATFNSGQQAVTGTAVNLGNNATTSVCVKANIANTINVYVGATGATTSTGFELAPGQGGCWNRTNTNLVFVVASTTGASVSFTY